MLSNLGRGLLLDDDDDDDDDEEEDDDITVLVVLSASVPPRTSRIMSVTNLLSSLLAKEEPGL
jgi:hypothetical protein